MRLHAPARTPLDEFESCRVSVTLGLHWSQSPLPLDWEHHFGPLGVGLIVTMGYGAVLYHRFTDLSENDLKIYENLRNSKKIY